MIQNDPIIHIIDDVANLQEVLAYLLDKQDDILSYDVETDGLVEKKCLLYGIGLCVEEHEGFYISVRRPDGTRVFTDEVLVEFLTTLCPQKKLVAWNGIFDMLVTKNNLGVDLTPHLHTDAMLLKHTLDEERPHGLKESAVKYLGEWADKAQDELRDNVLRKGGRWVQAQKDMYLADTDILGKYCIWDVVLTLKMYNHFRPKLAAEGLEDLFYKDEIMPLYREVVIPMRDKGFHVDLPHFEKLKTDLTREIETLEEDIYNVISPYTDAFDQAHLLAKYPTKRAGNFPKVYAEVIGFSLPRASAGNITLSKKDLEKLPVPTNPKHAVFLNWLLKDPIYGDSALDRDAITTTRKTLHYNATGSSRIFNLGSNANLAWLFFDKLGMECKDKTPTGQPKINAEAIEEMAGAHPFCDKIIEMKKLQKLLGTYVENILALNINGILYPSFLMHGTTSGRFSCAGGVNMQNLPATKEEDDAHLSPLVVLYTNEIRRGFISPPGWKIVDNDHEALEPRCFAHMSGDTNLQNVFHKGEDLYSSLAIKIFKKTDASPFKKDPNFLGKLYPDLRKLVKVFALAVAYGASAYRISFLMKKEAKEAQAIIDAYLAAYPGLQNYINSCHQSALNNGYVRTSFGRVRHLPEAKALYMKYGARLLEHRWAKQQRLEEERKTLKNLLNNSTNMPIQGLGAHIVNRGMLEIARQFKKQNINEYVGLQIHDQITCVVVDADAERSVPVIKKAMEEIVKISVSFKADPKIATNFKDSK